MAMRRVRHWHVVRMPWVFYGDMAILRECYGCSMDMPRVCYMRVMGMLRVCGGCDTGMLWVCRGDDSDFGMTGGRPWFAMGMPWVCHGGASLTVCYGHVLCMLWVCC